MSAQMDHGGALRLGPMRTDDLEAVLAIERRAYEFPWTQGNFIDSMAAGYLATVLRAGAQQELLLGYSLAMRGVDELHLLNLTVAPEAQGQGHAHLMLDALAAQGRQRGCTQILLEVRQSNARARALYARYGFAELGQRRGYYPAAGGQREDALVMCLALGGGAE